MKDEDVTTILGSEWPKDAGSPEFIRKLRFSIERDIELAKLYFPADLSGQANHLLHNFPVDKDYLRYVESDDDEKITKPNLLFYDLSRELNLDKLSIDDSRYWLDLGSRYGRRKNAPILDYHAKIHLKSDTGGWNELSLDAYRDRNIDSLTKETFSSSDLLDQLLVLTVIKGAQAGHKKCMDKMFDLFSAAARGIAHRFVDGWLREMSLKPSETGALARENVDSVADSILLLMIQGDPLKVLIGSIQEKRDVTLQLNRKLQAMLIERIIALPLQLQAFEINADQLERKDINDAKRLKKKLGVYAPDVRNSAWSAMVPFMRDFIVKSKNGSFEAIVENNGLEGEAVAAAQLISDWFARHIHRSHAKDTAIQYLTTLLNPFVMLMSHPDFNSTLYVPNKKAPFPVWLFGNPKADNFGQQGAFQRKLNDWFKSLCHHNKDKKTGKIYKTLKPEHYEGGTRSFDDGYSVIERVVTASVRKKSNILAPDEIEAVFGAVRELRSNNMISVRDGRIVTAYLLRVNYRVGLGVKITEEVLGKQFGLSARQIRRILVEFQKTALKK